PKLLEDGLKSWQEMEQYLVDLLAARRRDAATATARKDLLSSLTAAGEDASLLSEEEVRATVGMLLFAGHETTTNLITNGVLLLLRHPEALAALRRDPALLAPMIEEMLRYESPVQLITRIPDEDVVLAGQPVSKGQRVLLVLASANRDPAQFPEPDQFIIGRRENRHLSFGLGIHFCVGAALARVEAQLAFGQLLERWPTLRLADETIAWRDSLAFRCPQRLHITA
ncbi:MAG TPA: cytochrome P450, partial [Pseudomonadota bacterium]|nr:cytochrome P450 [Pseudomonadota bacterium]